MMPRKHFSNFTKKANGLDDSRFATYEISFKHELLDSVVDDILDIN